MDRQGELTFIEQARRRQIVEATIEVLAVEGAKGATFARIAAEAGISPSLISYHFSSKSMLLGHVVQHIVADMDAAITADIGEPENFRTVFRRLIESQVRYFGSHATAVVALGNVAAAGDPVVTEQLAGHRSATLRELQDLIEEGQASGDLAAGPSRPVAVTLLAALDAAPAELFGNPDADAEAYGRALADLFDAALAPRGRSWSPTAG